MLSDRAGRDTQELVRKSQALRSATQRSGFNLHQKGCVMKTITPFELQLLIDQCDVELIDVRPKKDFKKVHALGARSVPLSDLEPHSVLAHRKLDRRAPLYIMSREKAEASLTVCSLGGAGLVNPVVVEGGIKAWKGQCLPVVRNKPWRMPFIRSHAPADQTKGHDDYETATRSLAYA
jgi:rhodanese-related sulfurtransferase